MPEDVLIVVDEAYIEFVERADYPDLLAELRAGRRNLVLLRTFAKIYGLAGLRVGYAFGHPELISYIERARPTFNVNALGQAAALAALEDEEHVARSRAHASASRALFVRELRAPGLQPVPSETNFIAVHVGDDMAVTAGLMEHGLTGVAAGRLGPARLYPHLVRHRRRERALLHGAARGAEPVGDLVSKRQPHNTV